MYSVSARYPLLKTDALGKVDLRGLKETPWHKVWCDSTYAIVGMFHVQRPDGYLEGCLRWAVTGVYQGQLAGNPSRHVFTDTSDDARLVVSAPEFTGGIVSSRIYQLKAKAYPRVMKLTG